MIISELFSLHVSHYRSVLHQMNRSFAELLLKASHMNSTLTRVYYRSILQLTTFHVTQNPIFRDI